MQLRVIGGPSNNEYLDLVNRAEEEGVKPVIKLAMIECEPAREGEMVPVWQYGVPVTVDIKIRRRSTSQTHNTTCIEGVILAITFGKHVGKRVEGEIDWICGRIVGVIDFKEIVDEEASA